MLGWNVNNAGEGDTMRRSMRSDRFREWAASANEAQLTARLYTELSEYRWEALGSRETGENDDCVQRAQICARQLLSMGNQMRLEGQ
jgi:hypothetical protein